MKTFTKAKMQDPEDKLTFIDLFSGIGGFRIGMEQAGFDCVFSNDYDKYAKDHGFKHSVEELKEK